MSDQCQNPTDPPANLPDVMTNHTDEGRSYVFIGQSVDAYLSALEPDMCDLEAWR